MKPLQRGVGLALVLATVLRVRDRSDRYLFLWHRHGRCVRIRVQRRHRAAVRAPWTIPEFNLGGRINLLYCFFWGIAAVIWMRYGYPLSEAWRRCAARPPI